MRRLYNISGTIEERRWQFPLWHDETADTEREFGENQTNDGEHEFRIDMAARGDRCTDVMELGKENRF